MGVSEKFTISHMLAASITEGSFQAVESERNLRMLLPGILLYFTIPLSETLNYDTRVQLPVGVNDAEIEERIIQHLAAAAAMGRAHIGRREGQRGRPSSHGSPHFLIFTHPGQPAAPGASGEDNEPAVITVAGASSLEAPDVTEPSVHISLPPSLQTSPISSTAPGSTVTQGTSSVTRSSVASHPPTNLDTAGPSDFQSFSESLKSKFNAVSMRYSFSKFWLSKFVRRIKLCLEGIKSPYQRAREGERISFSHVVLPCRCLVPTFGAR